ncbi:DUF1841 family protein [Amantichitinum ursilacus]|uniref:DUF1841 domain-containing protein n=1 Tax=Amantichitinum ursilacus TaxID=857265 RepID=A0A0N1JTF9_9NEIS|nr:DUF1841 family protein [Amantichitinum ursilacus]KPC54526.1 hypothetical protein WG78_03090 [Amantichitinum ursilacus]
MLFNPSRDEARHFFIETWRKYRAQEVMTDLEKITASVLDRHPEYQPFLSPDYIDQDWPVEYGETNPFLHISMHLAIAEQLSIDQPFGIRDLHQQLVKAAGNEHDALHWMMEGLGEMLWQAQRYNLPPDPATYLSILRKKAGLPEA